MVFRSVPFFFCFVTLGTLVALVDSWAAPPSIRLRPRSALSVRMDATREKWRGPGNPNKVQKVYKPSWGDDFVDDLTNKRFGNGWAFYGQRETLKDKDYEQLSAEAVIILFYLLLQINSLC